jgi:uncharacterized cupin superfamily protein
MPKIDIDAVETEIGSTYPEPYASQMGGRAFQALGDAAGLTQFGDNMVTMPSGAISLLRHWHSGEDDPDGHHLQNRSGAPASFLAIGTRVERDTCTYSDVDLINHTEGPRNWFTLRDGTFVK